MVRISSLFLASFLLVTTLPADAGKAKNNKFLNGRGKWSRPNEDRDVVVEEVSAVQEVQAQGQALADEHEHDEESNKAEESPLDEEVCHVPRIFLMRHGVAEHNVSYDGQNVADGPLTELGQQQARNWQSSMPG